MSLITSLKTNLLTAPDEHMDASLFPIIEKWDDEPTTIQLLEIIDKAIYGSLMSEFLLIALQTLYNSKLKAEGKTHEDLVPLATWRKEFK
jgi:hypothetical protein